MKQEVQLKVENGKILVSSRVVAEDFGKQHKNVLQSIENLVAENSATKNMFIESAYPNRGKMYKEYLLTRDGFSLLVMGFTGKEALQWKLKYIEAFNKMEEALKHQAPQLTEKQQLQLMILNGGDMERIEALKQYESLVTKPLLETIEKQENEIEHKEDVIIGLVDDVTLADKRQRIVKIVKYGAKGLYAKRWGLLYKEFEEKYHVDVTRRMTNAKNRGEINKSLNKMDYICDVMGMTSQLYDVCVVVFEADYLACLEDMVHTIKREI